MMRARDCVRRGPVNLQDTNPADMFTKVLTRQVFKRHARVVMNWAADERPPDERMATEVKSKAKET